MWRVNAISTSKIEFGFVCTALQSAAEMICLFSASASALRLQPSNINAHRLTAGRWVPLLAPPFPAVVYLSNMPCATGPMIKFVICAAAACEACVELNVECALCPP